MVSPVFIYLLTNTRADSIPWLLGAAQSVDLESFRCVHSWAAVPYGGSTFRSMRSSPLIFLVFDLTYVSPTVYFLRNIFLRRASDGVTGDQHTFNLHLKVHLYFTF